MKKFGFLIAAVIILCGFSAISFGQNINHRQRRQQRRIGHGVTSGRLTPRETRHLERREGRINRIERRDRRSGGGLNRHERRNINRRLNRTSRAIFRQKHDRQGKHSRPIRRVWHRRH